MGIEVIKQKVVTNLTFTATIKDISKLIDENGNFVEPTIMAYLRELKNGDQIHFEIIKQK